MAEQHEVVDIAFPARGQTIPLDHGYALFSAITRVLPDIHQEAAWGIHPVFGEREGSSALRLGPLSRVKLRVPAVGLGRVIALSGATLDVAGSSIQLQAPTIFKLIPASSLRARYVNVKGFENEPADFEAALRRQLAHMPDLSQDRERISVTIGKRRVMRIAGRLVVGFAVGLEGLDADASITIQRCGLGGRRHMGGGMFVPPGPRG